LRISNSRWTAEIGAIVRKEALSEVRSKAGLLAGGVFGVVSTVALAMASATSSPSPSLAAGMVWVALLFSASVALPRAFVLEEELGTGDLLRLWARPHAVFWGKALFNSAIMVANATVLAGLYAFVGSVPIVDPALYVLSVFCGCFALSGVVTLCGALVSQAKNRSALAGALSIPVLFPLLFLGIESMRVAFGGGVAANGWQALLGMAGYATATLSLGPYLYSAVWKS
jgi:heme exporter protein B